MTKSYGMYYGAMFFSMLLIPVGLGMGLSPTRDLFEIYKNPGSTIGIVVKMTPKSQMITYSIEYGVGFQKYQIVSRFDPEDVAISLGDSIPIVYSKRNAACAKVEKFSEVFLVPIASVFFIALSPFLFWLTVKNKEWILDQDNSLDSR